MGRRVVLVLVAAMLVLAIAGTGRGYAAAGGLTAAREPLLTNMLRPAAAAATPGPGEIDRGFRLRAASCSIDPGFHLRRPNGDPVDPGFGRVPSPPPVPPRCSGTPVRATPASGP